MGGVIRRGKISSLFLEGEERGESMYHNGQEIWRKPIPSIYPIRGMTVTDEALMVGSSDIACLTYSTWSPRPHDWINTFRNNYQGAMIGEAGGRELPGMNIAVTLGRRLLTEIMDIADSGGYTGLSNPLDVNNLQNYEAILIDTSDEATFGRYTDPWQAPDGDPKYMITNMPMPFHWHMGHARQRWINEEMQARMRLVRLAHQAGITKMYLCSPWVRLGQIGQDVGNDDEWYFKFDALEDSMHYQQDRLNAQIKLEGLNVHVSLLPFHIILRDLYEDIENGTAPAGITDIRNLFALEDNTSNADPTDPNAPKHWYMLNYLGTYAINCLFDAVVLGGDPFAKPATDGFYVVPTAIADYFRAKAVDIRDNYSRAGRAGVSGYIGYQMPKIRDNRTPTEILGNKLLLHMNQPATVATPYNLVRSAVPRHTIAVYDIDVTHRAVDREVAAEIRGGGFDRAYTLMRVTDDNRLELDSGYEQSGSEWVTALGLQLIGARQRIVVDSLYPFPGWVDPILGHNNFVQVFNIDLPSVEYERENTITGALTTAGLLSPIANRAVFPNPAFICTDMIVSDAPMTDDERFHIFRWISRKYQTDYLWEPLWPDMVE